MTFLYRLYITDNFNRIHENGTYVSLDKAIIQGRNKSMFKFDFHIIKIKFQDNFKIESNNSKNEKMDGDLVYYYVTNNRFK